MKKLQRLALAAVLGSAAIVRAAGPDEFYMERLRVGKDAYVMGSYIEAADELRVACFGMLDDPVLLTEGLARLALAQQKGGRQAAAEATLTRFVEIERRFGKFRQASLEPPVRADFVALARKTLPVAIVGSLAGLSDAPAPAATAAPAPTPAPTPAPAPAAKVTPPSESETLVAVRREVAAGRAAQAWALAEPALKGPAPSRDMRKAALEAAVLAKQNEAAVPIAASLVPFQGGEEASTFYAAVAEWESGSKEKARELAASVAGKVAPSPWSDFYLKKILAR